MRRGSLRGKKRGRFSTQADASCPRLQGGPAKRSHARRAGARAAPCAARPPPRAPRNRWYNLKLPLPARPLRPRPPHVLRPAGRVRPRALPVAGQDNQRRRECAPRPSPSSLCTSFRLVLSTFLLHSSPTRCFPPHVTTPGLHHLPLRSHSCEGTQQPLSLSHTLPTPPPSPVCRSTFPPPARSPKTRNETPFALSSPTADAPGPVLPSEIRRAGGPGPVLLDAGAESGRGRRRRRALQRRHQPFRWKNPEKRPSRAVVLCCVVSRRRPRGEFRSLCCVLRLLVKR